MSINPQYFRKLLSALFILLGLTAKSQLTFNTGIHPSEYLSRITSKSITGIKNITYNSDDLNTVGYFSYQGGHFPLDSGILFATGDIRGLRGPNKVIDYFSFGPKRPGDEYLERLANDRTWDAAVLEFDFIASGDSLTIEYVFGSDEYDEFAPPHSIGFSDVFAFVLSGISTELSPINIATIPNSSTPVSVNSINKITNPDLFVYNGGANQQPAEPYFSDSTYIEFDGFTKPLKAIYPIECGETYHVKIAIADVHDAL